MDIRNTRQLKEFSAGRLANARDGQKIILYFSLITIAATALANVASYVLSRQIAKTGGLGSMGIRSALTTAQTLLPLVQAGFLMCLTLGYLATMLRIARGQYASPNGMRLGFDRFWVLLRCTLLKGLIFGGVAMASLYVAMMIYMMTPLSNSVVDILMPLVKNATASGIALDDATYAQLMSATAPAMVIFGVLFLALAAPLFYRYRMTDYLIIDRPAAGALAALRDSRMMTKGNRWNLFRLDLSMVVLRRRAGVRRGRLWRPASARAGRHISPLRHGCLLCIPRRVSGGDFRHILFPAQPGGSHLRSGLRFPPPPGAGE